MINFIKLLCSKLWFYIKIVLLEIKKNISDYDMETVIETVALTKGINGGLLRLVIGIMALAIGISIPISIKR